MEQIYLIFCNKHWNYSRSTGKLSKRLQFVSSNVSQYCNVAGKTIVIVIGLLKLILLTCPNKKQDELGRNTGVITDFVHAKKGDWKHPFDNFQGSYILWWIHYVQTWSVEMNTTFTFTVRKVLIYCGPPPPPIVQSKTTMNYSWLALCMVKCKSKVVPKIILM